ncbi:MAG: prepilin-type N-terminal cleavage/methylation domain-containing protein [Verrucomicrobiota bacterium]
MNRKNKPRSKRQGLTLVELLVVLTILIAVASIIIPILPDTNQLSNSSSGSANMREVVKVVETFRTETGAYPNSWDSLIDAGGDVLPTGTDAGATDDPDLDELDDLTPSTANETIIDNALLNAGIIESLQHTDFADTTVNQTFDGITDPEVNELPATIVVLTDDGEDRLGLTASQVNGGSGEVVAYAAFGLGQNNSMVGRTMADAPVKFLRGGENPTTQYARWVVIFTIFDDETVRLATVAGLEDSQLRGVNYHLDGFYESF